ncbi:MAG: hypothetical protein IKP19_05435 [Oscillospiraceae bacterium]|nr:hypothetical protein [Oscillospiraceae bacterium]
MTQIWISVITGCLTLLGVCVTAWASSKKTRDEVTDRLRLAQAVTDTKLDALTAEVRSHNNFARRMPVVEEQIKVINHRLADLEGKQ